MFNIIDRYTSRLFLGYFIAGLVVFATLFLAVDFLSFAVKNSDVSTQILLKYYAYYTPGIVYQMLPVGALVATVFTISSLNKSNELTALFSLGTSLARVSAPILILIGIISVLAFWMSDRVLPRFAQKKNYVYYVDIKKRPGLYSTVNTNRIWYRSENVLFNIKTLNTEAAKAQGLTLYYFDAAWNLIQMVTAKSMEIKGNIWELKDGTLTLFAPENSFPLTKSFETKQVTMNEDMADLTSTGNSSDIMSLGELSRFINRNKEAGLDTLRYEVDYHAKFGFALAAFVMSLLSIPFSVSRQRSGGAFVNIGMCLGLAFFYWVLLSSSITLGRHAYLPPILAAWGPNLVIMGLAIYLLLRLKR